MADTGPPYFLPSPIGGDPANGPAQIEALAVRVAAILDQLRAGTLPFGVLEVANAGAALDLRDDNSTTDFRLIAKPGGFTDLQVIGANDALVWTVLTIDHSDGTVTFGQPNATVVVLPSADRSFSHGGARAWPTTVSEEIGRFVVSVPAGLTCLLTRIRSSVVTAGGSVFKLQRRNGTGGAWADVRAGITPTAAAATLDVNPAVAVADGDEFRLLLQTAGTSKGGHVTPDFAFAVA